jgi:hypothetical protein
VARSLVINHQEEPSTNPLFTGFLLFAAGWLLLAGFVSEAPAGDRDASFESAFQAP